MNTADHCQKLLDNHWSIFLFRSGPDYAARACHRGNGKSTINVEDTTPSKALIRLTEKVCGVGEYEKEAKQ